MKRARSAIMRWADNWGGLIAVCAVCVCVCAVWTVICVVAHGSLGLAGGVSGDL